MPPKAKQAPTVASSVYLSPGYLVSAKSSELISRVRGCFDYLKALEQTDHEKLPPGLENCASQLLHDSILRSKYREVRVLAAQCAVELLRIYAPTPPYGPDDIKTIFDLIIEVLAHLKNGGHDEEEAAFEGAAHILESLDTVRSVCLMAEMANERFEENGADDEDADRQIVALFTTLFASIGEQTPKAVEERCNAVIGHVLDEIALITTPVVQALLLPLLNKEAEPRAAEACMAVLRRSEAKLAMPIGQTLLQFYKYGEAAAEAKKAVVMATSTAGARGGKKGAKRGKKRRGADSDDDDDDDEDEEDDDDSEAEAEKLLASASSSAAATLQAAQALGPFARPEVLQDVMVEASTVIPSVLMTLLPSLERELERPEAAPRLFAVAVLGRLFGASVTVQASEASLTGRHPIARAYSGTFKSWLRRFSDQDARIRRQMCLLGSEVMRAHHTHTSGIVDLLAAELTKRLSDPDDNVRHTAVIKACDCACSILDALPKSLIEGLAGRTHDKSAETRREACTGLAQAYAARLPSLWKREQAFALEHRDDTRQAIADAYASDNTADATASGAAGKKAASMSHSSITAAAGRYLLACPAPGSIRRLDLTGSERDMLAKLSLVPGRILPCYDHAEGEVRARVVQLLDQVVLPEASLLGDAVRSRGLLMLYASLSAEPASASSSSSSPRQQAPSKAESAFWRLQVARRDAQRAMASFLQARQALKDHQSRSIVGGGAAMVGGGKKAAAAADDDDDEDGSEEEENGSASATSRKKKANAAAAGAGGGKGASSELEQLKARLNRSIHELAERTLPVPVGGASAAASGAMSAAKAKAVGLFSTLAYHVQDNKLFKQLGTLSTAGVTSVELSKAKEELLSRLKMVGASTLSAATKASMEAPASASQQQQQYPISFNPDLKAVAEATRAYMRRMAMHTLTASMVPCLIQATHEAAIQGRAGTAARGLDLLRQMFTLFPDLVARLVDAARSNEGIVTPASDDADADDEEADAAHTSGKAAGGSSKGVNVRSSAEAGYASLNPVRRAFVRLAALTASLNPDIAIGALRTWAAIGGGGSRGTDIAMTIAEALLPDNVHAAFRERLLAYATSAAPSLAKHSVACACHIFSLGQNGGAGSSFSLDGTSAKPAASGGAGRKTLAAGKKGKAGKDADDHDDDGDGDSGSRSSSVLSSSSAFMPQDPFFGDLSKAFQAHGALDADSNSCVPSLLASAAALAKHAPAVFLRMDAGVDGNEDAGRYFRILPPSSSSSSASSAPPMPDKASFGGGIMRAALSFVDGTATTAMAVGRSRAGADDDDDESEENAEGDDDVSEDEAIEVEESSSEDEDAGFRKKPKRKGVQLANARAATAANKKQKAQPQVGVKRKRRADSDDDEDSEDESDSDEGASAPGAKRARGVVASFSPAAASKEDRHLHTSLQSREARLYKGAIQHSPKSVPFTLLRILSFKLMGAVSRALASVVMRSRALAASPQSSPSSSTSSAHSSFARVLATSKDETDKLEQRVRSTLMALGYEVGAALRTATTATSGARKTGGASNSFSFGHDDKEDDDSNRSGASLLGKTAAPPYDAASRCAAVIQWLRVVSNSRLEASMESRALSPQAYVSVAQFIAAPSDNKQQAALVREALLKVLFEKLKAVQLPLRYLPLPMMAASAVAASPSDRKKLKERLTVACESYRRAYQANSNNNNNNPSAPYLFLPEYSMPYAVFLLAHDDERMPPLRDALTWLATARKKQGSAAEGKKEGGASSSSGAGGEQGGSGGLDFGPLKQQASALTLLSEAILGSWTLLLSGGGASASSLTAAVTAKCSGSLSLLLTMLGVRIRESADAVDHTKTQALHAIADLAYVTLRSYGKQAAAFTPYAGEIKFPVLLYRPIPTHTSTGYGHGHVSKKEAAGSSSAGSSASSARQHQYGGASSAGTFSSAGSGGVRGR